MSLLIQRDLLSFAFLILCFVVVFGLMAVTRSPDQKRRRSK